MFRTTTTTTAAATRQHTTRPIVTGTSVLGIVYDQGVLLAADTLLSYGSMAMATANVSRLYMIPGTHCIVGASGKYSDFKKIQQILTAKALEETTTSLMADTTTTTTTTTSTEAEAAAKNIMTAEHTWNYLRMIMYSRRNKMNPYWNDLVVAGTTSGTTTTGSGTSSNKPFLGMVDKIGTTVQDNFIATGFGSYLALPLLREKWRPDLTEGEARALLEDCMKILFYRDCRASPRIQLAKCEGTTVLVSDPYEVETSWDAAAFVTPVADLEGDGGW